MNKYELAVVLSAKLEDDERTAALEKAISPVSAELLQMWMNGARKSLLTRSRK